MENKIVDLNNIDLKANFEIVYFHKRNMAGIAMNLIATSISTFNQCNIIPNLVFLKSKINDKINEDEFKKIAKIAFQEPIDNVRIIMCFENYMKAILLSKGYIIHQLDKNNVKIKSLINKNYDEPILLSELNQYESFYFNVDKNMHTINGIKKETLNVSRLFKEKFQDIISLPKEILDCIININTERNSLHYQIGYKFENSIKKISELEQLSFFVNNDMKIMIDNIILDNKLPARHLTNNFYKNIMS